MANWTAGTLAFYRDNNHMSIISALLSTVVGSVEASVATPGTLNTLEPEAQISILIDLFWQTLEINTIGRVYELTGLFTDPPSRNAMATILNGHRQRKLHHR
ncbi:hypothetical protein BJ878DRAFT_491058 [Calycina marina]|uniref:Uncharacterized protein n=1 Tax=Calycina marina TaxID=1763456 RepID=A0A9P7Z9B3_9HELO|nr:hypothetical protein BJ878DRAFT_491058 [Calycina marina]